MVIVAFLISAKDRHTYPKAATLVANLGLQTHSRRGMADPSSAAIAIQTEADTTTIVASGTINERSQLALPEDANIPLGKRIILDTAAVTRINSLGVAIWMRYMGKLSALGVPI